MRAQLSLIAAAAATFAVAGAASAAPRDMNDATYIAVARCAGMAQGVGADPAPFNAALDANVGGRTGDVMDRADQARSDAEHNAAHTGPDGRAAISRTLDNACKRYISAG